MTDCVRAACQWCLNWDETGPVMLILFRMSTGFLWEFWNDPLPGIVGGCHELLERSFPYYLPKRSKKIGTPLFDDHVG